MNSQHDLATGMLDGYIQSMIDPQCNAIAVKASANTAILIFRTLSIISADEDAKYTERLRRTFDMRQGRES
jgi:hypothetical protein